MRLEIEFDVIPARGVHLQGLVLVSGSSVQITQGRHTFRHSTHEYRSERETVLMQNPGLDTLKRMVAGALFMMARACIGKQPSKMQADRIFVYISARMDELLAAPTTPER